MQVFIIGSPYETAKVLDKKRLNKQIIECKQILNAIEGKNYAWKNHPCTIQYRNNTSWLNYYLECLINYQKANSGKLNPSYAFKCLELAYTLSSFCDWLRPNFHTSEYFDNMKRRLYTKDHNHYKQFESLGESYENWYWVDNNWKIYKQK